MACFCCLENLPEDAPCYFNEDSCYYIGNNKSRFQNFLKLFTMWFGIYILYIPGSIGALFGDQVTDTFDSAVYATGMATSYYYGDDELDDHRVNPVQKIIKYGDDDVWWAAKANEDAGLYGPFICFFAGFFVIANSASNIVPCTKHIVDKTHYPSGLLGGAVGGMSFVLATSLVNLVICILTIQYVWTYDYVHTFWMLLTIPTFVVIIAFICLFCGDAKTYFHFHFQAAFACEFTITFFTATLAFYQSFQGWGEGTITNYAFFVVLISGLDENVQSVIDFTITLSEALCNQEALRGEMKRQSSGEDVEAASSSAEDSKVILRANPLRSAEYQQKKQVEELLAFKAAMEQKQAAMEYQQKQIDQLLNFKAAMEEKQAATGEKLAAIMDKLAAAQGNGKSAPAKDGGGAAATQGDQEDHKLEHWDIVPSKTRPGEVSYKHKETGTKSKYHPGDERNKITKGNLSPGADGEETAIELIKET